MAEQATDHNIDTLDKRQWLIVLFLVTLALIIRVGIIPSTYDYDGDPGHRALQSYEWSLNPKWIGSEYWVPGFTYLHGTAMMFLKDPYYAPRIVNAIIGSFSVLAMYVVAHRLFGWFTAVLATTALVFLPLHVGLSVSGYTEAPFVTIILFSFFALTKAAAAKVENKSNHPLWMLVTIATMVAANMIRCESWLYLPLWIGFYFWRTRSIASTAIFTTALSIFPLTWLYGCWADYRMPLVSFSTTTDPRNRVLGPLEAAASFATSLFCHLGPIVPLAAAFGLTEQARAIATERARALWQERAIYLLWVSLIIAMDVGLTITYGPNMQDRFLLLLLVLLLPFAGVAFERLPYFSKKLSANNKSQAIASIIASFLIMESILFTVYLVRPHIFITTEKQTAMHELADWLKARDDKRRIVFTSLNYKAFTALLLNPALVGRSTIIMDFWTPLLDVQDKLSANPPELLVTETDDGKDLYALLQIADFHLEKEPLYEKSDIRVYQISPGTFKPKQNPKLPDCFWYPAPNWRTFNQMWKRKSTQQ